ncbi:MAG: tRNA adenosine(34) deaminase TadA [Gammaproteobacteria bacterium]|nr:tRNA adenosine(34) deaminase TadA [Gammaproteobacteria bacterium]
MTNHAADPFCSTDRAFMEAALALAERAEQAGEVPVGAVVVKDGDIIGHGFNRVISQHDASAHAEIEALREAGQACGNYRLPGTVLYVTLEPCAMCLGAMLHARIERLVFAATDPKTGALGGAFSLPDLHAHNHVIRVQGGLLADQAGAMLRSFFRQRR